ncbi:MAG: hypothetical protein JSR65_11735 [Proteobacteria bacterium]|nr:hypothetical protein [Pseudomonadota bacterium]
MNSSKRGFRAMAFGLVAAAGLASASIASAHDHFSLGINLPGLSVGIGGHHTYVGVGGGYYGGYGGGYYAPSYYAPTYYAPTYYAPPPVYYPSYPAYYSAPVVYRSGYYYRGRGYERGYERGYRNGYYDRGGYYNHNGYYGR